MTTVAEHMRLIQGALVNRSPTAAGPSVLVEAADQASPIPRIAEDPEKTRRRWRTIVLKPGTELQKADAHRVARTRQLTELQAFVTDDCIVHEIVKSDRNQSRSVCIGRGPRNDVIISDPTISSRHASVGSEEEEISLTDLSSSNGTFVNGQKVDPPSPMILKNGDLIKFGHRMFYFLDGRRFQQFIEIRIITRVQLHS